MQHADDAVAISTGMKRITRSLCVGHDLFDGCDQINCLVCCFFDWEVFSGIPDEAVPVLMSPPSKCERQRLVIGFDLKNGGGAVAGAFAFAGRLVNVADVVWRPSVCANAEADKHNPVHIQRNIPKF